VSTTLYANNLPPSAPEETLAGKLGLLGILLSAKTAADTSAMC